ncbi:archaeosortase/exosortase family protein [Blastochloris sulfoviridis]|uniref:Exosortase/archaeosortase family protein n=1 Tax=Blastochloris sulfoviridis TaxID=50712 RepID=A0A5M6HWP9_9HYPH|nr:archaeosortase/exosortase family protein [Blastochloris sulfoviridis]KAA5600340.1 exosortase/archaeosortase family protein [Blastochloris sulfoviridis]
MTEWNGRPSNSTLRNSLFRDRHVLLIFLCCVVVAVAWPRGQRVSDSIDVSNFLVDAAAVGAGELVALTALFVVIQRFRDDVLLSARDNWLLAAASFPIALAPLHAASAAMAAVGLAFAFRKDARLAAVGQLLLALASYETFGPLIFRLVLPLVLAFEASLAGHLLSLFGDFTRDGDMIVAPNGHAIFIEVPCSSFHNLTFSMLLCMSLLKIEKLTISRSDVPLFLAMAGITIVFNLTRIGLMAQSVAYYEFWHDGLGVKIYSVGLLACLVATYGLFRPSTAAQT